MKKQIQFNMACYGGDLETAKALINHPDVGISDDDNFAIHLAAANGYKGIVELLMQDSRVDPSAFDNDTIRWAAYHGRKEVIELLLTDKRVVDRIDVALKKCKEKGGYELLKACVDERERVLEREKRKKEKQRRIQEAIEEMSADCELYF